MAQISVVIPAFNRQSTLGRTLRSLTSQTYRDWTAVVVDDGSTDATAEVAREYRDRDRRVQVHTQTNRGVSAARNQALALIRSPWVLFLDADDWLADDALGALHGAVTGSPDLDLVHGRGVRVMRDGALVTERPAPAGEDLFTVFARTCAFSIHTCLIRTELVRAVGGFDESFETCEDWDLWLRVARTRPRSAPLVATIGYYRIRTDSASRVGRRLMRDGSRVIDLGHGEDPRMASWPSGLHPAVDIDLAPAAKLYLATFAAGLASAGGDPAAILDSAPECAVGDMDGRAIAETTFTAISEAHADPPTQWINAPAEQHESATRLIHAVCERAHDPGLEPVARGELERLALAAVAVEELPSSRTYGLSQLIRRDIDLPSRGFTIQPDAERVVLDAFHRGRPLGAIVLPALDETLPRVVAADAIAHRHGWELLGRFFSETVYPDLVLEYVDGHLRIRRDGVLIGEGATLAQEAEAEAVHRIAGWTVFLQELWGRRDLDADAFYRDGEDDAYDAKAPSTRDLVVEISGPLRAIRARHDIVVDVRCGGVPVLALRLQPRAGEISPGRLRHAITQTGRMELCRVAVRESLVFSDAGGGATLRGRLARCADAQRRHPEGVPSQDHVRRIGRRLTGNLTGASGRVASLPTAVADQAADAARARGQTVIEPDAGPGIDGVLYDPSVFDPVALAVHFDLESLPISQELQDAFAAGEDPWDYSSEYEQRKYLDTLALIPETSHRAAEIGCAEGIFTERLAGRARALTGYDISRLALERARARCFSLPHVRFEQLNIFAARLPGQYDLIVCSEVLCLIREPAELEHAAAALADALEVGGLLVATHHTALVDDRSAPGFDWDVVVGAAGIQDALLGTGKLALRAERRAPTHLAQRYERLTRRVRWRRRVELAPTVTEVELPPLKPALAAHFRLGGGTVGESVEGPPTRFETHRLPILAFGRISRDGDSRSHRRTLSSSELDEHLGRLVGEGFRSAQVDEWALADSEARSLPGRRMVLTFEDADEDFPETVLPLLERYELSAELFVVVDRVTGRIKQAGPLGSMRSATLAGLPRRRVRVGSAGRSGQVLPGLGGLAVTRELMDSRLRLEQALQRTVGTLAYPAGAVDGAVAQLAIAAGFDFGFAGGGWPVSPGEDHLALPRIWIQGERSAQQIEQVITFTA